MEDFAMEWNDICRVCLQDGELISFYTKDECDITLFDKIMFCAAVNINTGENLPESICQTCIQNLEVAFKFRTLCENSDNILQSYKLDERVDVKADNETLLLAERGGSVFQYKLPQDLKVQKVTQSHGHKSKSNKKTTDRHKTTTEQQDNDENYVYDAQQHLSMVYKQEIPDMDDEEMVEEVTVKVEIDSDNNCEETEQQNLDYEASGAQIYEDDDDNLTELSLAREIRLANAELIELDPSQILDSDNMAELHGLDIKTENDGGYLVIKKISTNDMHHQQELDGMMECVDIKPVKQTKGRRRKDDKVARPHMCEICGKTYRYNFNLEAHMRRHTGEKPFCCNICGRGFVISFELRRHMRCHTGQKPYKCKYCERKFSDFGSRIKHQRSHTGERPYACDVCGKTFAYSHVLSSHKLIHSGIKAYKCEACDKRFTKSHHLKAHLNVHLRNGIIKQPKNPVSAQVQAAMTQPKVEPIDNDNLSDDEEENSHPHLMTEEELLLA